MGPRKAEGQRFVALLHSLIDDCSQSQRSIDIVRDKHTIRTRFNSEGFSFLSKTLPLIGKALDIGLDTCKFICPSNFKKYKGTALPELFQGLLKQVFDSSGILLPAPSVAAISEIRQLTYFFYKYRTPFTDKQLMKAEMKFKEVDSRLPDLSSVSAVTTDVLNLAAQFIRDLFSDMSYEDLIPKHGPGITASGDKPHQKMQFKTHYRSIHDEFPYYRFFSLNTAHLRANAFNYWKRVREEVGSNKVLFVPKDSRGPRTIACEPTEYMWVQQALRARLYEHIEAHPLTCGRINFTDQSINQNLAMLGSKDKPELATIDLQDASDSVSVVLVDRLFADVPVLLRKLTALRTPYSVLPSGERVVLKKYAAMGSALCFPVEAVVFYAIAVSCYAFFEHLKPVTYVYGDDIIVNREIVPLLTSVFQELGIHVNANKSFYKGLFRESCGGDYFGGVQVTPTRCKTLDVNEASDLAAVVELSNNLFDKGYYNAARYVERLCPHWIPYGNQNSPYLCYFSRRSRQPTTGKTRFNQRYQFEERRVPYLKGRPYTWMSKDASGDWDEYFRKHVSGWSENFEAGTYSKRGADIAWKYVDIRL